MKAEFEKLNTIFPEDDGSMPVNTGRFQSGLFRGVIAEVFETGTTQAYGFVKVLAKAHTDNPLEFVRVDPSSWNDVYLHCIDCQGVLENGACVVFRLECDTKRQGKFRAKKAHRITFQEMHMFRMRFHRKMPQVFEGARNSVLKNRPLQEVIHTEVLHDMFRGGGSDRIKKVKDFLEAEFDGLVRIGFGPEYVIEVKPEFWNKYFEKKKPLIARECARYTEIGMAGMSEMLADQAAVFFPFARALLHLIRLEDRVVASWLFDKVYGAKDQECLSRLSDAVCDFAGQLNGIPGASLRILPVETLAAIFVAAPVAHVAWNDNPSDDSIHGKSMATDQTSFYQLYSGNEWHGFTRALCPELYPLSQLKGALFDNRVFQAISEARKIFQSVLVLTPDLRGSDVWKGVASEDSHLGADPFVIGFHEDFPFPVLVTRFSGGPATVVVDEMIAGTIAAVEKLASDHNQPGKRVAYLNQFMAAYEEGQLFAWLRGEWRLTLKTLESYEEKKTLLEARERARAAQERDTQSRAVETGAVPTS